MIDALLMGRAHGTPAGRTSKNGNPYATLVLRTSLRDGSTIFANCIGFDATVIAAFLALSDGDGCALSGELTPKCWVDREGNAKPQLDVLAHQVLSPYSVTRKRAAAKPTPQNASAGSGGSAGRDPELDDDVSETPF
jgi:Single-strand binding protein family